MQKLYLNMDTFPPCQAILVENGLITAKGDTKEVSKQIKNIMDCEIKDLTGLSLYPGFIDAHSHLLMYAKKLTMLDVSPFPTGQCESITDIIKLCMAELSVNYNKYSENRWLVGMGYDNSSYNDDKKLTMKNLNSISKDIPIVIVHSSGHVATANSKALKLLGYMDEEGDIINVPIGGDVNMEGEIKEAALMDERIQQLIKGPDNEEIIKAIKEASQIYAGYGITTAQEGCAQLEDYELLLEAGRRGYLLQDVVVYLTIHAINKGSIVPSKAYEGKVRVAGIKLYLDGSPQARTAWVTEAYYELPKGVSASYRGMQIMQDEDLINTMKKAVLNNWQMCIHANGDAAIEQMINCYTYASYNEARPVIIHCQMVRNDQLDRIKDLKIIPSFFVDHVYYFGDFHALHSIGPKRAARISPLASALERNIIFTIHQDSPVVKPDMLMSIHNAVNRITKKGKILGEEETIPVIKAIEAVTKNSAYQIFEEKCKGCIAEGMKADFVILDKNPISINKENINKIKVLETIKEGNTIYKSLLE